MIVRLLLLWFILASFAGTASDSSRVGIRLKVHYGSIIPHRSAVNYLIRGHISLCEFEVTKKAGNRAWESSNNFPSTGISLRYSNLANPDRFGFLFSAIPYVDFIPARFKNSYLAFRVGGGLGYVHTPFDRVENFKNVMIGSRVNGAVIYELSYNWRLRNLCFTHGISLGHLSNGAIRMPNLGINTLTFHSGFGFGAFNVKPPYEQTEINYSKQPRFSIIGFGGIKEIFPPGGKKFFPAGISLGLWKQVRPKGKIGFTSDHFYDRSVQARDEKYLQRELPGSYSYRSGIAIGYEFMLGNLSVPVQFGGYVFTKDREDGYFYDRLGLRYYFPSGLIGNITIKAHWAKADILEAGLGYRF